jgi:hypothetical protein
MLDLGTPSLLLLPAFSADCLFNSVQFCSILLLVKLTPQLTFPQIPLCIVQIVFSNFNDSGAGNEI